MGCLGIPFSGCYDVTMSDGARDIPQRVREFVEQFREKIEPLWSDDLMWRKFRKMPDDAVSAGYCGPSSVLLFKELQREFHDERFSVAVGTVHYGRSEFIRGKHVWVAWHHGLSSSTIIDVTADQSKKTAGKILVGSIDALSEDDIHYSAYRLAYKIDDVDESVRRRSEVLERRLEDAGSAYDICAKVLDYYRVAQDLSADKVSDIDVRVSQLYAFGPIISFTYGGVRYSIIDDYSLDDRQELMRDVLRSAGLSTKGSPIENPRPQSDGAKYAGGIDGVEYYLWRHS